MLKKHKHEIKSIKLEEIRVNEYNPNVVSDLTMSQLVQKIRTDGILQPILLRNVKQNGKIKYEIVDGEHRYLAAKQLDYEEIPAIVVNKELPEAMISTISMNKLRGEFDTLKLAEVIHELNKIYTTEELEEKIGYTPEQLDGMEGLLNYDTQSPEDNDLKLQKELPEEVTFKLRLTVKQYETIESTIKMTNRRDRGVALVSICLDYIKRNAN